MLYMYETLHSFTLYEPNDLEMCIMDNLCTSYTSPKILQKIGEISSNAFSPWECAKLFIPREQQSSSKESASTDIHAFMNNCTNSNGKLTSQRTELTQKICFLFRHKNIGGSACGDGLAYVDESTLPPRILHDRLQIPYIEPDDATVIISSTNWLKDEYEIPQSETVLRVNPEEIAKDEVNESFTEIEWLTLIAGKDTSVENIPQNRWYQKQQFPIDLGMYDLGTGNRALLPERLLETDKSNTYFMKQYKVNFEAESIYCLITRNQFYLPVVVCICLENRSHSHIIHLHTKNMKQRSNSFEGEVGSIRQKRKSSLDTRKNFLRERKYVVFRQEFSVSVPDISVHYLCILLGEDYIFVSHSKEGYVTFEGNKQGKCRKLWNILEMGLFIYAVLNGITATSVVHKTSEEFIGAIDEEKSCSTLRGITAMRVLYKTMTDFLEASHKYCQEGELIAIFVLFFTSDIELDNGCPEICPRDLSMQQYKEFLCKMCQIDDYDAQNKLLALPCQGAHMMLEDNGIVLSTFDVRPQPSTTETQGRVKDDILKHFSSKRKIQREKNKTHTTQTSCTETDTSTRMFDINLFLVPDVTFDKWENVKCYEDTRHSGVYLDDTKLQSLNPIGSFNEGSSEEIDLKRRKKHNLRQMIWLSLEELPPPQVHREVIVAFFSGEYSQTQREANPCPVEHEELGEILKKLASDDILAPHITMKYEILRLCTMRNYPRENKPFAVRLVAAGFYYAGHSDQLICYCCAIRKDGWVDGDIPVLIHQKKSPDCSFLTNNASVNIPIKRPTLAESPSVGHLDIQRSDGSNQSNIAQCDSSTMFPSSERNPVNISNMHQHTLEINKGSSLNQPNVTGEQHVFDNWQTISAHTDSVQDPPPKYLQYAVKNMRINSFQGWPADHGQRPEEMAECGFFYVGFSDCVRCFHCGVGLQHWMREDDPWIEHARTSASCVYVHKTKGGEFVSLVQMAVEIAEKEAVKNSGGESNFNQNNREEVTAVTINDDTAGNTAATGGAVEKATSSTPSSGDTEVQAYLLTDAAQSVLAMGYQPKVVLRAIRRVLTKKRSEELTGQLIMEAVLDIDDEEAAKSQPPPILPHADGGGETTVRVNDGHEAEGGDTGNEPSADKQIDPEKTMRENRELRDATLCKICLDNTISVVFLPCGHLVTCADCAPAMRKCPICRTLIKGTVKTFVG